jgi:hypothetical protein
VTIPFLEWAYMSNSAYKLSLWVPNTSKVIVRPRRKRSDWESRKIPIGLPQQYMTRLKYCDEVSINASATQAANYDFRANDLYDPDVTSTGHQPMGFDQLALFYGRFTVLRSKITVTPMQETVNNTVPGALGIALVQAAGALHNDTIGQCFEQKLVTKPLEVGIASLLPYKRNLTMSFDARKFFGYSPSIPLRDDVLDCTASASPSRVAYFEVFIASIASNDPAATNCLVEIEYEVLCKEPIVQGQS